MRAVICNGFGSPDVLSIVDIAKPIPKEHEVLIKNHASALNRADLLQRRGFYPPPPGVTEVLGLEIAGEVVACGSQVTACQVGDRVFGLVAGGGYADFCTIDAELTLPIPDQLSYTQAACIPEAFLTANEALTTLAQLQKNECILIHAGGSGVGSAAIQLAKQCGAFVYTTVGSSEKIAKVKDLGADQVIHYKTQDFFNLIPAGVDVILDFVGASYLAQHIELLKPNGRLISIGLMGGTKASIDLEKILRKRLQIKGLVMRTRDLKDKRAMVLRFAQQWLPLFATGQLKPIMDSIFKLDDIKSAHTYMETNANVGKIAIEI